MKRLFSLVAGVLIAGSFLHAQTLEQGKKFFYYERYKSARETLEKVLAANPNNLEAVYWLGQSLLGLKDSVGAKELYSKSLAQNGNAPLILAGMGQIELMEGKSNDARQRFETAISLTKGKDINVINAVGLANVKTKAGDPTYAVEKLMLGTQLKDFKNPDTYVIMGDAYRKLIDGGNAVTSFTKSLGLDPRMAAAKHKIGMVYLTQNNKDYFLPAFEEAVSLDANYAPAIYELYYYYYFRDINKAAEYFDKYLAVSDPSASNEYDRISILWARKMYAEAIAASQQKISNEGANADPRYYKLIAYSYDDMKDSVNAKSFMAQYFTKQKPEDIVTKDYSFYAKLLGRLNEYADAYKNYQLAIDTDTSMTNKFDLMREASELAKKSGDRKAQADWLGRIYYSKAKPNNRDLYDYGFAHYQAANYDSSYALFDIYRGKYPNEIFGFLWAARSMQAKDTTFELGLAAAEYEKLAEAGKRIDSVKYKNQIIQAYGVLASYHNNVKKDKAAAIAWLQKILDIDPSNTSAKEFIEKLQQAGNRPTTPARPQQRTGGAATGAKSG